MFKNFLICLKFILEGTPKLFLFIIKISALYFIICFFGNISESYINKIILNKEQTSFNINFNIHFLLYDFLIGIAMFIMSCIILVIIYIILIIGNLTRILYKDCISKINSYIENDIENDIENNYVNIEEQQQQSNTGFTYVRSFFNKFM